MQRERNRDRERFETDRERDHSRRTAEHNQSPSHPRRPSSPSASPVLTERLVSDSEHHIYSRSSERSGSCSSISPPRFEKPDRIRLDRYSKSDKLEKERPLFEADRANGGEKERRAGRKDKGEKDRTEKHKLRKLKLSSPSVLSSETDLEPDRDASPDTAQHNSGKTLAKEKESGKGRLDLPPCVVHLTRVREKEGKFIDHAIVETQRIKAASDHLHSPAPPLADHKTMLHRIEIQSREVLKHGKMPKDKCLASQIEIVDKESKIKGRKYLKAEPVFEKSNSDADRLAARKRRFEEETTRANRLRRVSQDADEGRFGLKWLGNIHFSKGLEEDKKFTQLEMPKQESRIDKKECLVTLSTTSEGPDSEMSKNLGPSIDLQPQELAEEATDPINDLDQRMHGFGAKDEQCLSLKVTDDRNSEMEQDLIGLKRLSALQQIDALNSEERLLFDLDHSQSCRKQMEQSHCLQQQLQGCDNRDKTENTFNIDVQDFDHQGLVHVLGKPPLDVTDVSPPLKRKRLEAFDYHFITNKECNYQGPRQLNDDSERNVTSALVDEDLPADSLHLNADKAKDKPKPENSHWDGFKRNNHNTVTDIGWESKTKQDTLKEMSFPSTTVKRESIRKRLVHELEPGEVRSDSDDDDDYTHMSPKLDTSLKRESEGKVMDLKLSGSLERNKFYEFALDKTITPDTKALLERAKSLSSSREDNWSFLGYDSRFTSFRNCTDKEKVEPTPRPIPSWYMKKKKIRSDSEGKLDDKKENPKREEQENGELFASRFLHSSIFEQDSRRLRHLEYKDNDPEIGIREKAMITVEKAETVGSDFLQEPIVLFHNRFLELQQKKDKDQESHSSEKTTEAETVEKNTAPDQEQVQSPKEPDVVIDLKSASPLLSESLLSPTETFVHQTKPAHPVTESSLLPGIDENFEDTQIVSDRLSSPVNDVKAAHAVSTSPLTKMDNTEVEPEEEIYEHQGIAVNTLAEKQNADVKPPTLGACLSNLEAESDPAECLSPIPAKLKDVQVPLKVELAEEKAEYLDCNSHQNVESSLEMQLVVSEPEVEPTQPARKQTKNKKAKANPSALLPMLPCQPASIEKPAIRKSERIDREKLKRSSSPRGEVTNIISDSKNSSKSPVYATDLEQMNDPTMPHARTRQRRNVRSVYATPHEDEAHQQQGKDFAESSRSMRKRADKESVQQDLLTPPASTRRGRPPKTRKRVDDVSSVKGEQTKTPELDDPGIKESGKGAELTKVAEGWRSPRFQKVQAIVRAGQCRKPAKTDKPSEVDTSESLKSQVKAKDETPFLEKVAKKSETDLLDKTQMSEKSVKVKVPRLTRNTKTVPIDKSVNLKNLVIDLSGDAVKDALYSGDECSQHCQEPSKKTKTELYVKEESKTAKYFKESDHLSPNEREEVLTDVEPPVEPEAVFLARQMELERAVENISNLAVEQPPPYKEPSCQPPVVTPVAAESDQTEVEKPANPASETELAAAIDSITAENITADADGFHTPAYTSLLPTSESLVLPTSNEVIEPETDLVIKNIRNFETSSNLTPDSKSSQPTVVSECPPSEVPKKGGRPRLKTPKKSKGRKVSANKKSDVISHAVLEAELAAVKLPDSIPEDMQTVNLKTATSAAAATVVTVAAACKNDVASVVTLNTPKEAEQPIIDQPEPQESAFHSGTNSPSYLRSPEPLSEPVAPALTPPSTCLNVTPSHSAKVPHTTPDWVTRTEEKVIPPVHKVAVVASAPTVVVGGHSANTSVPPDTKASDIDPSSSTLRKILMEPKYVSSLNSNSVPSTLLTTSLTDPRMSQNESLPVIKSSVLEDRPSPVTPVTPQMVPPQQPPPQPSETLNIFKEKMGNTVISSAATSVISRIPMPFDFDSTPHISLSNRNSGLSQPKHKYRFGMNDNNRYHGLSNSDEGRSSDNTPNNTGSGPGLRVNTSEGVMVLSYSGQKTEGPQRIVAKISQIPPASAVDIEFQQSVSKSHVKQEQLQPQPSTPKASQTPTAQGHTGAILSNQGFNAQPVISSMKKEGPVTAKSESSSHIGSQGAPLKTFQHLSPGHQVLRYNQSMLQQHIKKASVVESVSVKADVKQSQSFNHTPVLSPHPSPVQGNHISSPATPNDRLVCHPKHELHCPRTLASPFSKICPPSTSVGLGASGPNYVTNVHHPEQSVIIHPSNATQSVTIGQLSQGNVRMNTPPLAGINYGIRTDTLSSPTQRSTTPQPAIMRDRLLKQHASADQLSGANENDVRHFHQGTRRTSVAQLHSDVVVIQPEYKGIHHGGLHLDHYNRDLRVLMPQQLTEHPGVLEAHKAQTPEPPSLSSPSHISSASSKSPSVKNPSLTLRDSPKALEVKTSQSTHSPHSENRVIGHTPASVISAQGVQRIHPGSPGSIPEFYREMHGFHSQLPGSSVIGINMANYGIAPSQVSNHSVNKWWEKSFSCSVMFTKFRFITTCLKFQ